MIYKCFQCGLKMTFLKTYSFKGGQKHMSVSKAVWKRKGATELKLTSITEAPERVSNIMRFRADLLLLPTISLINHSLDHHGKHPPIKVKVQL